MSSFIKRISKSKSGRIPSNETSNLDDLIAIQHSFDWNFSKDVTLSNMLAIIPIQKNKNVNCDVEPETFLKSIRIQM